MTALAVSATMTVTPNHGTRESSFTATFTLVLGPNDPCPTGQDPKRASFTWQDSGHTLYPLGSAAPGMDPQTSTCAATLLAHPPAPFSRPGHAYNVCADYQYDPQNQNPPPQHACAVFSMDPAPAPTPPAPAPSPPRAGPTPGARPTAVPSPAATPSPTPSGSPSPSPPTSAMVAAQPPPPDAAASQVSPPDPPLPARNIPVPMVAGATLAVVLGALLAIVRPPLIGGAGARGVVAGLVLVIVGLGLGGYAVTRSPRSLPSACDRRPASWSAAHTVAVPSSRYPTLQQAIDDVPDATTITLTPGTYDGALVVEGKRLRLMGSGGSSPTTLTAGRSEAVITFGACGGGALDGLTVRGGTFGVSGSYRSRVKPGSVALHAVNLEGNGTAVAGTFWSLAVSASSAHDSVADGFNVSTGSVEMADVEVDRTGKAGIRVYDNDLSAGGKIHLNTMTVHNAADGGIWIYGHATPITIEHCDCQSNKYSAIVLESADGAVISRSSMVNSGQVGEKKWGVGVLVSESLDVTVRDSSLSYNPLAGVWLRGCESGDRAASLVMTDNTINFTLFAFALDPLEGCATPYGPQLTESGNTCLPDDCRGGESHITPIKPPPEH